MNGAVILAQGEILALTPVLTSAGRNGLTVRTHEQPESYGQPMQFITAPSPVMRARYGELDFVVLAIYSLN